MTAVESAVASSFDPSCAIKASCPSSECVSTSLDLEPIHDFAVDLILRAGALLRSHTWRRAAASHRRTNDEAMRNGLEASEVKDSQVDLVTKVDVEIEEFLRGEIESAWPGHDVVAEESFGKRGADKQRWIRGRGPTWFLDPLDGTLNATHLFPLHCISIGFTCTHTSPPSNDSTTALRIHDDALVGVIYAPSMGATGTLWSGARGRGAYLSYPTALPSNNNAASAKAQHGCRLSELEQSTSLSFTSSDRNEECFPATLAQRLPLVRQPLPARAPSGILFASEWGKDRRRGANGEGNLARKMRTMTNMAAQDYVSASSAVPSEDGRYVHGVRSLGSSTLDLAFVAQGSIDVLWEGGCWEWDVCAGVALLLEAGGLLTDSNPPPPSSSLWLDSNSRLPRAELGARRFLAVRACTADGTGLNVETGAEAQARVVREVWRRTDGLSYRRDGVRYAIEEQEVPSTSPIIASVKATSSVRDWCDPLRERKRLTREEAEAQARAIEREGATAPSAAAAAAATETFGGRLFDSTKDVWSFNAWDHVEPPASYVALVEERLTEQAKSRVSIEDAAKYHAAPSTFWNSFYAIHENRFFKDRRWLHLEFPELIAASTAEAPPTRIWEVGCGAGNTVFPLLECNQNSRLEVFASDYAPEAVQIVRSHALYAAPPNGARCVASVWDLAQQTAEGEPSIPSEIAPHSLDIVVLIFVLSALHPDEWQRAVANVRHALKPGGLVLVRDYGRHDLPQIRFGRNKLLDDNLYVRGDGTRVYFFTPEEFLAIFNADLPSTASLPADRDVASNKKDFATLQLANDRRMLLNRKEKKQMFRNWIQAKFRFTP